MSAANFLTAVPAAERTTLPSRAELRSERPDNTARDDRPAFRDELDRAAQAPAERPRAVDEPTSRETNADTERLDNDAATASPGRSETATADVDVADATNSAADELVDPVAAQADELVASLAGLAQALRDGQRVAGPAGLGGEDSAALDDIALTPDPVPTEPGLAANFATTLDANPVVDLGAIRGVNPVVGLVVDSAAEVLTPRVDPLAGALTPGGLGPLAGLNPDVAARTTLDVSQGTPLGVAADAGVASAVSAAARAVVSTSRPGTDASREPRGLTPGSASGIASGATLDSAQTVPPADAASGAALPAAATAALPTANAVGVDALPGDAALRPAGVGATPTAVGGGAQGLADADADAEIDGLNATRLSRALNSAVKQNGGGLTLRLTPAALGTVRIDLQLQGASVSADFLAENEAGGRLLNRQLVQLRAALESQGLTVERLGVQVKGQTFTGGSGPQSDGQSARQDQGSDPARSGSPDAGGGQSRGRERSDAEAEARRDAPTAGRTTDGRDFRSLFGDE